MRPDTREFLAQLFEWRDGACTITETPAQQTMVIFRQQSLSQAGGINGFNGICVYRSFDYF
ncbi:MAG: hypothetical protein IPH35_08620 [Rhodoferax sp.]|nr:hypothetical protein [Rhodoferax sp.]